MSNDTAPQVDTSQSPVTLLAQVLRDLIQREREIDRMEVTQETDQDQIETYRRCNLQAIEGVEKVMGCLAAADPKEAIVQVLVAAGQLNSIDTTSDDGWLPDRLDTAVQLLRSALPVLAATTQVDLSEYGMERYGIAVRPSPFFAAHKKIGTADSPDAV